MRWRTRAGDEMEAQLGEDNTKDITPQAWRTALDPQGEWIPAVLRAADRRLTEVRERVPDAGGLVIATDQTAARAYAEHPRGDHRASRPTVVLSDEPRAARSIDRVLAPSNEPLDGRGADGVGGRRCARLAVGVYATSASTPLFFAQAIGRFVRARRRGETASVFLPNVPHAARLAGELEGERDHVLGRAGSGDWTEEDALVAQALQQRDDATSSWTTTS